MAKVTPVSANRCVGEFENGDPNVQLRCLKGFDINDEPIFTCVTMRLFQVACPKLNQICSTQSQAFVSAITICNQRLF